MNSGEPSVRPASRVMSLDALRGFDMFCLLGGQQIVVALAKDAPEGSFLHSLKQQFTHVEWADLFVALGSNSILAYLTASLFVSVFTALATALFDGLKLWLSAYWHGVWMTVAKFGLAWLFFIYLHHRKLHLRL